MVLEILVSREHGVIFLARYGTISCKISCLEALQDGLVLILAKKLYETNY